jgi:hypothetical protein
MPRDRVWVITVTGPAAVALRCMAAGGVGSGAHSAVEKV